MEERYSFISRPTGVDWVPELVEGFLSMEGGRRTAAPNLSLFDIYIIKY